MPLPLVVSLLYAVGHPIARRKRAPFAQKGSAAYVFLRLTVVVLGLPLFLVGGSAPPLTLLSFACMPHLSVPVAVVELSILPFTIGAIIYCGLRLLFRLTRGHIGQYLDYGVTIYYVSMTIVAVYGFLVATMAIL
ncbi:MAG: hypothetical protein LBD10_02535 [Desulfobulbus sp.]|jgi:hypothetical protein|uniref:hypothetical protein n=1 Tax=Desulfobulbus sp. TaxID=895 RepID=UPI00284F4C2C|nr:hypothetical protein [Desulfobulbus sp.]MDR2549072.1 hypothetical protein [Desulfobulbus sp.]